MVSLFVCFQLLFKKVIPHHCLGSIWSQRDKKQNKHSAPTIRATITQFNAVAACVVSTILHRRQIRPHLRARVIKRWIDIAQECRMRKNFSSLHAIVSALQSNPLYRLKRAWSCVHKWVFHKLNAYELISHSQLM